MSADNEIMVFERADGRFAVREEVSFYALGEPIAVTDAMMASAPSYATMEEALQAAYARADEKDGLGEPLEHGVCLYRRINWETGYQV